MLLLFVLSHAPTVLPSSLCMPMPTTHSYELRRRNTRAERRPREKKEEGEKRNAALRVRNSSIWRSIFTLFFF